MLFCNNTSQICYHIDLFINVKTVIAQLTLTKVKTKKKQEKM